MIATIKAGRNLAHFIVVDDDYDKTFVRNKPRLIRVGRLPEKTGFEGLGFKIRYDEEKDGHYVDQVFDEGPAKDAGLKVGDRIIIPRIIAENVISISTGPTHFIYRTSRKI